MRFLLPTGCTHHPTSWRRRMKDMSAVRAYGRSLNDLKALTRRLDCERRSALVKYPRNSRNLPYIEPTSITTRSVATILCFHSAYSKYWASFGISEQCCNGKWHPVNFEPHWGLTKNSVLATLLVTVCRRILPVRRIDPAELTNIPVTWSRWVVISWWMWMMEGSR